MRVPNLKRTAGNRDIPTVRQLPRRWELRLGTRDLVQRRGGGVLGLRRVCLSCLRGHDPTRDAGDALI